jgi:26S proteasome regulatory subunit N2
VVVAHGYMSAGTTRDAFLRQNLEWLGRASNWSKFGSTASLGVIHKGNVSQSLTLLRPYLPTPGAQSLSPYSEGGALYALGLIHASEGVAPSAKQAALDHLLASLEEVGASAGSLARSFTHAPPLPPPFAGHDAGV